MAEAFGVSRASAVRPGAHFNEGTRAIEPPAGREPVIGVHQPPPLPRSPRAVIGADFDDEPAIGEPMIGAEPLGPPARRRPPAPYVVDEREAARRRYRPPMDSPLAKPLPSLYGNHRWLGYWYIPAAAVVAIGVAGAVIFAAERIFGGDDSNDRIPAAVVTTPDTSSATTAAVAGSPTPAGGTPSATAGGTPSAVAGAKFQAGQTVVVTGAGDCLNVRTAPGRLNDAIVCVPDGTELTIRGGPETAGDLRWWRVQTLQGEGWAAEDFLVRKP